MQVRISLAENLFIWLGMVGCITFIVIAISFSLSIPSKPLASISVPTPNILMPIFLVDAEKEAERLNQYAVVTEEQARANKFSGPETAGAEIVVAGKKIKMPDDAEMFGVAFFIDCGVVVPKCATPPLLNIKRGDDPIKDVIAVELRTGEIWPEIKALETAPDEYLAKFKFLTDALGKDKLVDVIALRQEMNATLQRKIQESQGK